MSEKLIPGKDVRWDLSYLYAGPNDPQIDIDVNDWACKAVTFYCTYKGFVSQNLPQAIRDYIDLHVIINKVTWFLQLSQALDESDIAVQAKIAEVCKRVNIVSGSNLNFLGHEIGELDVGEIQSYAEADPFIAKYLPWIWQIRSYNVYHLSELSEEIITRYGKFGLNAWTTFFNEVVADLRFPWCGEEKTFPEMRQVLSTDTNSDVRALALETINNVLSSYFAKYSAQTLHVVVGTAEIDNSVHGLRHPMDNRNKSNQLTDSTVDNFHNVVQQIAVPLTQRYFKLKTSILHLSAPRWSDVSAPMSFLEPEQILFDEAVKIVTSAYRAISPTVATVITGIVTDKCIDAPIMMGKRGGAYNFSSVLPDGTPKSHILLNCLGSSRDIVTLAHELGHGVNGIFSGYEQGALMQRASGVISESTALFGEVITFDYLKKQLEVSGERKKLLRLLMQNLEDTITSVVSQICLSNFERQLHGWNKDTGKWGKIRKLSVKEINEMWLGNLYQFYGKPGEIFTFENAEHLWSGIPHFQWLFYLYGYAFAWIFARSLLAARLRIGDKFESLYLDMLKGGSTKCVAEVLASFGLNVEDPSFYEEAIQIGMLEPLNEAEQLAHELGLVE
ncbi:MAG: M3 family metallopeptidase [bacterium]|nr:M3 family metallopeptidase [bacterium]